MAQKPFGEDVHITDHLIPEQRSGQTDTSNQVSEMSVNPKDWSGIHDNAPLMQTVTKSDIYPLEKTIQSLENDVQFLGRDVQTLGTDVQALCDNTNIKIDVLSMNIRAHSDNLDIKIDVLCKDIQAISDNLDIKLELWSKNLQITMLKLFIGSVGIIVASITLLGQLGLLNN